MSSLHNHKNIIKDDTIFLPLALLLLLSPLATAAPAHRGLVPFTMDRPSYTHETRTQHPWRNPCAGNDFVHVIPTDFLSAVDIPRSPELDDSLLFAGELQSLLSETERIVDIIQGYMVENHFGQNSSHVSAINSSPSLPGFDSHFEELINQASHEGLQTLYDGLVRSAIYIAKLRHDLQEDPIRTHHEDTLIQAFNVLAHGGWDGIANREAGIYQLLCRLYTYLSANGNHPTENDLGFGIIPQHVLNPADKAARHNRDFYILSNLKRLLNRAHTSLKVSQERTKKGAPRAENETPQLIGQ